MKRFPLFIVLCVAGLASCGGGNPPTGTIGCSCREFVSATCEGIEAAKGLEDDLLNYCTTSFEPDCVAGGGLFDPVLPCSSENRYAVCEIELPASGFVRVKTWKSPDWGDADRTDIESECDLMGGTLRFE